MCFKTAKLAAPAEKKAKALRIDDEQTGRFTVSVKATGTREVYIKFGDSADEEGYPGRYASPEGLRNLAAELTKLADELAA